MVLVLRSPTPTVTPGTPTASGCSTTLDTDPDELTNLAVHQRDPAARSATVDVLVDEMTRADDLTRPEPVGRDLSTVGASCRANYW